MVSVLVHNFIVSACLSTTKVRLKLHKSRFNLLQSMIYSKVVHCQIEITFAHVQGFFLAHNKQFMGDYARLHAFKTIYLCYLS